MKEIIEKNKNNKLNTYIEPYSLNTYKESYSLNKSEFQKYFYSFKNLLSSKSNNDFIEHNVPKIILQELIKNFSREFKQNIIYNNLIFENTNLIITENLPHSFKVVISQRIIKEFESDYASPFVDIFYFVEMIIIRCQFCNNIIDCRDNVLFSLSFRIINESNIKDLIDNNINQEISNNSYICPNCQALNFKKEKLFLNSPKYLIFVFENKSYINLDDTIDLSRYILTNVGSRKYGFFAVINEENLDNNLHYILGIKKNNIYYFFSDNDCQKSGEEVKSCGKPCIAIYKGLS